MPIRHPTTLGPWGLLILLVSVSALVPGLALAAVSPGAWPLPLMGLVGVMLVLRRAARPGGESTVSSEAARGIAEIEGWLAERDRA